MTYPVDGGWVEMCADTLGPEPRWLSVVRPGEGVTIRVRGATSAKGVVHVHPRGCEGRTVGHFEISRPTTRWLVRLRPGMRYELSVWIAEFTTAAGWSGQISGALGLLVSTTRSSDVIPARRSLACGR